MTQPQESTLPAVRWLTVDEVAAYFRVNRMTVYRKIKNGELPAMQFGRSFRISEADVLTILNAGRPQK